MGEGGRTEQLVLVVDDETHARTIHVTWLSHAGYATAEAESGETGLHAARVLQPQVVLIDLKMPGVDGWKVMEQLRSDPATRAMLLVALTIIGPGEDRRDPVRRGFDEHWVKPISAPTLLANVERLIGPPVR